MERKNKKAENIFRAVLYFWIFAGWFILFFIIKSKFWLTIFGILFVLSISILAFIGGTWGLPLRSPKSNL